MELRDSSRDGAPSLVFDFASERYDVEVLGWLDRVLWPIFMVAVAVVAIGSDAPGTVLLGGSLFVIWNLAMSQVTLPLPGAGTRRRAWLTRTAVNGLLVAGFAVLAGPAASSWAVLAPLLWGVVLAVPVRVDALVSCGLLTLCGVLGGHLAGETAFPLLVGAVAPLGTALLWGYALDAIRRESSRVYDAIQRHRAFELVTPQELLAAALRVNERRIVANDVEVHCDYADDLSLVETQVERVLQILVQLIASAVEALEQTPEPRTLELVLRQDGGFVAFVVRDNGPTGENRLTQLFERPADPAGGVDLGALRADLAAMGGSFDVGEAGAAGGPRFTLRLRSAGQRHH